MSVFGEDGREDAEAGRKPSPPDSVTRFDGETTDVYAMEYMEGYREACEEK